MYEEIRALVGDQYGQHPPMPVLQTQSGKDIAVRRVFRKGDDGSLVPVLYHDSGLYAEGARVRTRDGEYEDARLFFQQDGDLLEPLYDRASIQHDDGKFMNAREAIYDFADVRREGEYIDADTIYDMGGEEDYEATYDVGDEQLAVSADNEAVYAMGDDGMSDDGGAQRRGSEDAVYDVGQEGDFDGDFDPTYDLGHGDMDAYLAKHSHQVFDQQLLYDAGLDGLGSNGEHHSPTYDTANKRLSETNVLGYGHSSNKNGNKNGGGSAYDLGDGDERDPTYDTATFTRGESQAALTADKNSEATYDMGDGQAAEQLSGNGGSSQDPVYALGDDGQAGADEVGMGTVAEHRAVSAIRVPNGRDSDAASSTASRDIYPEASSDAGTFVGHWQGGDDEHDVDVDDCDDDGESDVLQQSTVSVQPYRLQKGASQLYDVTPANNQAPPSEAASRHASNSDGRRESEDLYSMANKLGLGAGGSQDSFELATGALEPPRSPTTAPPPLHSNNHRHHHRQHHHHRHHHPHDQRGKQPHQHGKKGHKGFLGLFAAKRKDSDAYERIDETTDDEHWDTEGSSGSEFDDNDDGDDLLHSRPGPNNTLIVKRRGEADVEDVYAVIRRTPVPSERSSSSPLPPAFHSAASHEEHGGNQQPKQQQQGDLGTSTSSSQPGKRTSTYSMEWDPNLV